MFFAHLFVIAKIWEWKKKNFFRMYLFLANYRNKIFSLILLSKCTIKFLVRILLIFAIVYCKKVAQNIKEKTIITNFVIVKNKVNLSTLFY